MIPKVLVVGDVLLDRWTLGKATRVSPEAPALIIDRTSERIGPGGAASVAYIAAGLGAEVKVLANWSDCDNGKRLLRLMGECGVFCGGPIGPRLTVKHRICAESNGHGLHQVVRIDENVDCLVDVRPYLATLLDGWTPDVVLVADYGRGVLSDHVIGAIAAYADCCLDAPFPVFVDPARGREITDYRGASLVKMNRAEAAGYLTEPMSRALGCWIMETLDKDGAVLRCDGGRLLLCPSLATHVVDVTGAGDSMLAAMGVYAATNLDWRSEPRKLLAVAMRAAAEEVAAFGVVQVSKAVLEVGDAISC